MANCSPYSMTKQVEIKQVRSNSFSSKYQPYEKRRTSQPQQQMDCTFECQQKQMDYKSSWSTTDIQEQYTQSQILQALEQQIRINQILEENIKNQQIELNAMYQEQANVQEILEQLKVYKEVVDQLEVKIKKVLDDNQQLNQINTQMRIKEQQYQDDLMKQSQIMNDRMSDADTKRKIKRLFEENVILRESNKQMENECNELKESLDQFKQTVLAFKLSQSKASQRDSSRSFYETELENHITYLQSIMEVDSMKMVALEEKVNLLIKENMRMAEQVRARKRNI